jgi:glycosyltransferase involved in cell wall biosynthesis
MTRNYLLVTPVKNEEESLPKLITSISKQLTRPILWLIVDDGSTDKCPEIIKKASEENAWIKSIQLKEGPRDVNLHYGHVCIVGFENAIKIAGDLGFNYGYIALLDADMWIHPDYFSTLIEYMEKDNKIGIASGNIWSLINDEYVEEKRWHDFPSGGARIWTRKCFEETGGYELKIGTDSISTARAKLKGWKTINIVAVRAYQSRSVYSAEGEWKGYKKSGEADYYLRCHPIVIAGRTCIMILRKKVIPGISYAWGYVNASLIGLPRLDDEELERYFRTKSIRTFLRDSK